VVIVTLVPDGADEPVMVTPAPVVEVWSEDAPPLEIVVVDDPCAVVSGCSTTRAAVPMLAALLSSPP